MVGQCGGSWNVAAVALNMVERGKKPVSKGKEELAFVGKEIE